MNSYEEDDCPICATIPAGKIFQCKEGHIVCECCLHAIQTNAVAANTLPKCPSCSEPLDNSAVSRCRALENIMDRLVLDCQNAKRGCQVKLKRSEAKDHESSCLYGKGYKICSLLYSFANCNFMLSVDTAKTVVQHIKSSHPSVNFQGSRICWNPWNLKKCWSDIAAKNRSYQPFTFTLQVPNGQHYVLLGIKVSEHSVSFYTIDLTMSLSAKDKLRITFSIPNDTAPVLSWSMPLACGIDSWKFLRDINCMNQFEVGIQSLLEQSDENGNIQLFVDIKSG